MASEETYSIGNVVKKLQATHPDLTVSKVRYLESEGLLTPRRTKSGYRVYTNRDIARLETVLRLQSTCFYPLAVIKERLDAGALDDDIEAQAAGAEKTEEKAEAAALTLDEIAERHEVPAAFVRTLAEAGLLVLGRSSDGRATVAGRDLPLVLAAHGLNRYGIDPRFLKANVQHANREVPLFKQAILGVRGRTALEDDEARAEFDATLAELIELGNTVTGCLISRDVRQEFNYPEDRR